MSNLNVGLINGQDADAGRAKAYGTISGVGVVALQDTFSVSSATDNGTGNYSSNFTNAFATVTFCSLVGIVDTTTSTRIFRGYSQSVSNFTQQHFNAAGTPGDVASANFCAFGDLA